MDVYRLKKAVGPVGATIIVALLLVLIIGQRAGWFGQSSDWSTYHDKTFAVTRVVDGDTIRVRQPDGDENTTAIRLWGIDTPELQHRSDGPAAQPWGAEARDLAIELVDGKMVTLKLEMHDTRDKYGRLLAYVHLPDGRSLNEIMLQRGLARAELRFSHSLINEYEALEKQARREMKGRWGGLPPGWVVEKSKAGSTRPTREEARP